MRRRTDPSDPSLIRVRTPQRQHRGRRLWNLSRGSKHHPRARSPDSHPRSRASTGLDALFLERHCGIFQRPPRSRAQPPPRGVPSRLLLAVPRLRAREFFLKRSVLLRLHLLQSSPRRRRCRVGRARPRARTAYRTIDGDVRVSAPRAHGSHRREQFRANRRRRRRRRTRRTQTPARRREGRRGRRGRRRRHRRYRRGVPRDGIHLFIGARAEIRTRTSRGGGRQRGKLGGVECRDRSRSAASTDLADDTSDSRRADVRVRDGEIDVPIVSFRLARFVSRRRVSLCRVSLDPAKTSSTSAKRSRVRSSARTFDGVAHSGSSSKSSTPASKT